MTYKHGIYRDKKEKGEQLFFDKVYDIKMPCKELGGELCSIYMIKFAHDEEGNGEIVYIKPNSQFATIQYTDTRISSGYGYKFYTKDEIGGVVRFCNKYYPYEVVQPYYGDISAAEPLQDNNKKLIAYYDTCKDISRVEERGFNNCINLKNAVFPYLTSTGQFAFSNCDSLETINLSALEELGFSSFSGCDNLKYVWIDNSKLKSIGNGFGDEGQIIIDAQKYYETGECAILTSVIRITRISNDNIYTINSWTLPQTDLQEIYVKNLTYINGVSIPSSPSNLKIYVNNETLVSQGNGYGQENCIVTSRNGKKLMMCVNGLSAIKSRQIDNVSNGYPFGNLNNLTCIDIESDTLTTIDNKILLSKDGKTLYKVTKTDGILDRIQEMCQLTYENPLTCLYQFAFNSLYNIEGEKTYNFDSVVKIGEATFRQMSAKNGKSYSVVLNNCKIVEGNPFSDCTRVKSIEMREMTGINDRFAYSTHGNTVLVEITSPKAQSIGVQSFYNRTVLSTCYFPNTKSVGKQAFYSCQSLISANFESCTDFGDNVFEGCFTYDSTKTHKIYKLKDMWCNSIDKNYMTNNYKRIKIPCGCVCHCSDGDYTVPDYSY